MTASLVVLAAPEFRDAAAVEAARLGVPLIGEMAEAAGVGELALRLDEGGWSLIDPATGSPRHEPVTIRCDLLEGDLGGRLRAGAQHESRFAKALGLKRYPAPRVLDATAGLGRESVLAAALGCTVTACERSPVVVLLLRDGLARAVEAGLDEIVGRIVLREADAREVMRGLGDGARPDVVLLDPMFPERKKSAAVKKEMQLLHRLLGSPPVGEDAALLDVALATARRRVVVKRPVHAPALEPTGGARRPELTVDGRSARYDVYLTAAVRVAADAVGEG